MEASSPPRLPEPAPAVVSAAARLSRTERRVKAAADALRTLVRDLHLERLGAATPREAAIPLDLRLTVRPAADWELAFDPPLAEQLGRQLEEAEADRAVYQPGRVYCFRCASATCEHAVPFSPAAVFRGYSQTGLAEWQDLHQAFVEARDSRVDRLFSGPPQVLTLVQLGHALRWRQLSSFGRSSKTYAVLGQVIAGYFRLPRRAAESDDARRLALTLQVVETRGPDGELGLKLNTLAGLAAPQGIEELLVSDWEPWVYRARELTARALEDLERRANQARLARKPEDLQAALRRVPAVLRRLAEYLERGQRQGLRRTRHVEDRRQEQRPVPKALDDARTAAAEAVFHDEKSRALVVCGPQGRTHVFSVDGRHVTSFVLKPAAVGFRVRTRRWRPATAEEAEALRNRIRAQLAASPVEPD